MAIEVRSYTRKTKSGKAVTVRGYTRKSIGSIKAGAGMEIVTGKGRQCVGVRKWDSRDKPSGNCSGPRMTMVDQHGKYIAQLGRMTPRRIDWGSSSPVNGKRAAPPQKYKSKK